MAVMAHLFACVWWGTPSNDLCGKSGIRIRRGRCKINHITLFWTSLKPFSVICCVSSPTRVHTHNLLSRNSEIVQFNQQPRRWWWWLFCWLCFEVGKVTLTHIRLKDIVKVDHGKNRECIFNSMVMVDGANVMALKSAARGTSPLSERLRLAAAFHTSLPCLQLHLKKKILSLLIHCTV